MKLKKTPISKKPNSLLLSAFLNNLQVYFGKIKGGSGLILKLSNLLHMLNNTSGCERSPNYWDIWRVLRSTCYAEHASDYCAVHLCCENNLFDNVFIFFEANPSCI